MPPDRALLSIALLALGLALNAHYPSRRLAALAFPSFIAGWLTSELALQLIAIEALASAALIAQGALSQTLGWYGFAIMLLASIATLRLWLVSRAAGPQLERLLGESFGDELNEASLPPSSRALFPFARSDAAVQAHLNLRYAEGAGSRHLLDVYAPRQGVTGAPVLLQIHGGGWFTGHKRQQALPLMLHMARKGWVCVAPNYRLSPRATFPEHLIDIKLALRWIREHIAEYGGDPDYVAASGGSAGGHLCALLALTPNDPRYQPGFEHVDTTLRACVPLYGVYDLTDRHRHQRHFGLRLLASRVLLHKRWRDDPQAFDRASPLSLVTEAAPPCFVIHGTHDNMASVEDARAFVALLRERSRQPVLYAELSGAHHAFEILHSRRTSHVVHAIERFLALIHARDQRGTGRPRA